MMLLCCHRLAASTLTRSRCVVARNVVLNNTRLTYHSAAAAGKRCSFSRGVKVSSIVSSRVKNKQQQQLCRFSFPILSRRAASSSTKKTSTSKTTTWWTNPELWGVITAVSGWTMSIAAFYDSLQDGPEVISLNMTGVLIIYSSLFLRWAFIVRPRNLLLASCHFANVCAQTNQMRRAIQYKMDQGETKELEDLAKKAGAVGGIIALSVTGGPRLQKVIEKAHLGKLSELAAAPAGPFTVHFWAPMSKWLISGASLVDYNRPTENISLPQYAALTSCGILHARYALLVIPTNYMLCSVNLALFFSSAWHLVRKLKADYVDKIKETAREEDELLEEEKMPEAAIGGLPASTLKKRRTTWVLDGIQKAEPKKE